MVRLAKLDNTLQSEHCFFHISSYGVIGSRGRRFERNGLAAANQYSSYS